MLATSAQAPALGPTAGGYSLSAIKQNRSSLPIVEGPQYTTEVRLLYPTNASVFSQRCVGRWRGERH